VAAEHVKVASKHAEMAFKQRRSLSDMPETEFVLFQVSALRVLCG